MSTLRTITICASLAATLAMIGCSANDRGSASAGHPSVSSLLAPLRGIAAKPDSVPNPPPPSPGRKQVVTVQFAGADTVAAGQSSNTRWNFRNSGHSSISVTWVLTNGQGWSGFPKQGTLDLPPLDSLVLTVAVAVPDTALSGPCPLHLTATPAHGPVATADGAVQVQNGTPPPDSLVTVLR